MHATTGEPFDPKLAMSWWKMRCSDFDVVWQEMHWFGPALLHVVVVWGAAEWWQRRRRRDEVDQCARPCQRP
jgi:hypothetical protein